MTCSPSMLKVRKKKSPDSAITTGRKDVRLVGYTSKEGLSISTTCPMPNHTTFVPSTEYTANHTLVLHKLQPCHLAPAKVQRRINIANKRREYARQEYEQLQQSQPATNKVVYQYDDCRTRSRRIGYASSMIYTPQESFDWKIVPNVELRRRNTMLLESGRNPPRSSTPFIATRYDSKGTLLSQD